MRSIRGVLLALFVMVVANVHPVSEVDAHHGRPHTFSECVQVGGDISLSDRWMTCRVTGGEVERVYGVVPTGSGEQVPVELVSETQITVVTYAFFPGRTSEIEVGRELISCMSRAGAGTPSTCPPMP